MFLGGYVEYVDKDSDIIYDIDEEREMLRKAYLEGKELTMGKRKKTSPAEKYKYLGTKRGERGVFELEEIVELLTSERVADLAVIRIPAERKYADYMVVGTASSSRHNTTVSNLIVSVYKRKMLPGYGHNNYRNSWVSHACRIPHYVSYGSPIKS